jgi:hypothetical protein
MEWLHLSISRIFLYDKSQFKKRISILQDADKWKNTHHKKLLPT